MVKLKKIKPMFDHLILTMDKVEHEQIVNGIVLPDKIKGGIKELQKVVAVGPLVRYVSEGDIVCFNPSAYGRPVQEKDQNSITSKVDGYHVKMEYNFPTIQLDNVDYLYISERDIDFIVTEFEEVPEKEPSVIQVPDQLIL